MDLGSKIVQLPKNKGFSRDNLAKEVGISSTIFGHYERNEITPSVEVVIKIAEALEVSLDYLVDNASVVIKDKKMPYRLALLEKIAEDDKNTIIKVVDSFLKDAQLTQTHKKLK